MRSISSKSIAAPRPGPFGHMHHAVAADDDVLLQPVLLRAVGQQHLEELGVADRGDDMEVGDVVQRIAAVMDLVVHAEGLGEMRGLHQRGDAALHRDVAAQEVGGLLA